MKQLSFVCLAVALACVLYACSNDDQGPSAGVATVTGFVKDANSRQPLSGVALEGKAGTDIVTTTTTDAQGKFELRFNIDSAMVAKVSIRNVTGYRDTLDIPFSVKPNEALLKDIDLSPKSQVIGGGGNTSGVAQTIAFLGANPTLVSVYGVGGQETSILGWEARDSLGLPIDAAHAIQIRFTAVNGPNGGEYISPTVLTTNAVGRAFTAFNSGTRSGVVQIVASATVNNRTIQSSPVRLVIRAGLPDQAHFTIAPRQHNFPTLGIVNKRNAMSVLVGDRYTNPVVEGTAIYFRSSAGVIQASVFTTPDGQGTADLISGNPAPFGPNAAQQYGDGYHYVVAQTIGEGGAIVKDSTLILWSGAAQISNIVPNSINVPRRGSQSFSFQVSDYLGHPLAEGTALTVEATTPGITVNFGRGGSLAIDRDVIFPGPGTTQFSFSLSDGRDPAIPDSLMRTVAAAVSITVTGPNGNATSGITGVLR